MLGSCPSRLDGEMIRYTLEFSIVTTYRILALPHNWLNQRHHRSCLSRVHFPVRFLGDPETYYQQDFVRSVHIKAYSKLSNI